MRICRITLDIAYKDSEDAPKTERTLRNLVDKTLDPALGEYMSCSTGVVVKQIDFPDPTESSKVMAWHQYADRQFAILDVDRFAVTHAVSPPMPIERTLKRAARTK
jgi:hypothetical protein